MNMISTYEASHLANHWFQVLQPVYLDTETTGLGSDAEAVQIAIIDSNGRTLINELLKPLSPIPAEASAIHHIFNHDVLLSPSYKELHREVSHFLLGRHVAIYNADYDVRILQQTAALFDLYLPAFNPLCVMKLYAKFYQEYKSNGDLKWQKLTNAITQCNIDFDLTKAHDALSDCQMTRLVLAHMSHSHHDTN